MGRVWLAVVLVVAVNCIGALPVGAAGPPFRVVIDAGHGGKDPGAISPLLPLAEKEVALDVALRLGAALQRRGVHVVHTRTSDQYVGLAERAAVAGRVGADALVSIHLNATATGNAAASGAEGWHGAGERDSELAGALLNGLAPPLRRHGLGVRGTRSGAELTVLRTAVPAALIELGYVTNPTDARALASPGVRGDIAEGLADGVTRFRDGRTQARPQIMLASMGGVGLGGGQLSNLYFVRPGDTLRAIAAHLGVPDAALRLLDGGQPAATSPQPLHVGQPLAITTAGTASAPRPAPVRTTAAAVSGPWRGVHVVSKGDTLTRIAASHGVPLHDLARTNGLDDPDLIKVGQQLQLAASGSAVSAKGATNERHTVSAGETFSHVALKWDTTVEALQRANGLSDADHVEAGRVLVRPAN